MWNVLTETFIQSIDKVLNIVQIVSAVFLQRIYEIFMAVDILTSAIQR